MEEIDYSYEITQLIRWNESLSRRMRECTREASRWIRFMMVENKALIDTLRRMRGW